MKNTVPTHELTQSKESKVPFKIVPLEIKAPYDTSIPHRHSYYELFFFKKGGGKHYIDFQEFPIQNHSIHFVSPGQVHKVMRQNGSFGFVILFSDDFYGLSFKTTDLLRQHPFLHNNSTQQVLNLLEKDFLVFENWIEQIMYESGQQEDMKEEMLRSYINLILIQSKRFYTENKAADVQESSQVVLFQKFHQLLEQSYAALYGPAHYATQLNISEKYLNEVVKKVSGKTVSEHLAQRTILEAKRLLLHSGLSFKEIGYSLNFQDPSYFSRYFKKHTGFTPGNFRQKEREKFK